MKFYVEMNETCRFIVEAESEEEALFWTQIHSINDVQELTTEYDINYEDHVCKAAEDSVTAFKI